MILVKWAFNFFTQSLIMCVNLWAKFNKRCWNITFYHQQLVSKSSLVPLLKNWMTLKIICGELQVVWCPGLQDPFLLGFGQVNLVLGCSNKLFVWSTHCRQEITYCNCEGSGLGLFGLLHV